MTSPTFTLTPDAVLTFKYFREVHGDQPGSSGRDTLTVQVLAVLLSEILSVFVFEIGG